VGIPSKSTPWPKPPPSTLNSSEHICINFSNYSLENLHLSTSHQ